GRTPGSLLTTRDTVFKLTPATRATSRIVGLSLTRLNPPAIRLPPDAALASTLVPPDCADPAPDNVVTFSHPSRAVRSRRSPTTGSSPPPPRGRRRARARAGPDRAHPGPRTCAARHRSPQAAHARSR